MTGLKEARGRMGRCLRRKSCDPRELFGKVQVRETVRRSEEKSEIRLLRARLKVAEADRDVARADADVVRADVGVVKAQLAKERAKPPRTVEKVRRVEVPVEVEVPGPERVVEREVPVEIPVPVEPMQSELPGHIERDLDRLEGRIPAARANRIRLKLEEKSDLPRSLVRVEP